MRDIVLKSVSARPTPISKGAPLEIKATNVAPLKTFVERLFAVVGTFGSKGQQLLDPSSRTYAIIQPAHQQEVSVVSDAPINLGLKKRSLKGVKRTPSQLPGKIKRAAKSAGTKVTGSLKTPLGKVSAIQAIALVAVFGFALHNRPNTASLQTRNIGQSIQNSYVSRYLPTVDAYSTPQPFSQNLASVPQNSTPTQAWLTPWNISDIASDSNSYSSLSAFWLTVNPDGVGLTPKADWSAWDNYLANNKSNTQTYYLTVSGDPDYTYQMLADPDKEKLHIANLLNVVTEQKFDGIDIDYEGLGIENRQNFNDFIKQLTTAFHAQHKLVSVTVEARIANQVPMDWYTLGQTADEVRVMAYDYHSQKTAVPGPVSPLGWVQEILDYSKKNIPNNKLVIGLGNYGYDWTQDTAGEDAWTGVGLSYDQAVSLAKEKGAVITRADGIDDRGYALGSIPMFTYTDDQNRQHSVWFEDQKSLQAKLNLVNQYQTAGVIFWSVGLTDTTNREQQ